MWESRAYKYYYNIYIYNIWYIIYLLYTRSSYIIYIVICLKRIFRVVVRLRTFIVPMLYYHFCFVFYSTVVRLVSYIGIVQISIWFEIAHFRDASGSVVIIYNIFILYFLILLYNRRLTSVRLSCYRISSERCGVEPETRITVVQPSWPREQNTQSVGQLWQVKNTQYFNIYILCCSIHSKYFKTRHNIKIIIIYTCT